MLHEVERHSVKTGYIIKKSEKQKRGHYLARPVLLENSLMVVII